MKKDNVFIEILLYFGAEPHKNKLFGLQKVIFGMFLFQKSRKHGSFLKIQIPKQNPSRS